MEATQEHELYLNELFENSYMNGKTSYRHEMTQLMNDVSSELKDLKIKMFALMEKKQ